MKLTSLRLLPVVVTLFLLVGCNALSASSTRAISISVWMHTGTQVEEDVILAQAAEFNAMQEEYMVEVAELPEVAYPEYVEQAAEDGALPCLLDFDGPFLYSYVSRQQLRPLDAFVSYEMRQDFLPSILEQGTYQQELYSLGSFDSGLALWGNRAYLEAAGVRIPDSVEEAWTQEEFESALAALAELPEITYPLDMKLNYEPGEWLTFGFAPLVQSFGGDLIDRSAYRSVSGVIDGPDSVRALETLQQWIKQGWVNPEPAADDEFYGSKTAALSWVGHWMYPQHKEGLGEDLVLIPLPNFGKGVKTGMGSWNWGITTTCEHPEGAWAFLNYILQPEQIIRMTNTNGAIPARKSAFSLNRELYSEGGIFQVYVDQLVGGYAVARPVTPHYGVITREFSGAMRAIIHGADVQSVLSQAAEAIDAELAASGR